MSDRVFLTAREQLAEAFREVATARRERRELARRFNELAAALEPLVNACEVAFVPDDHRFDPDEDVSSSWPMASGVFRYGSESRTTTGNRLRPSMISVAGLPPMPASMALLTSATLSP